MFVLGLGDLKNFISKLVITNMNIAITANDLLIDD